MTEILTIIAPVFLTMFLGFGLGKTRLFPEGAVDALIAFVWYVAIPALMFRSLAPNALPLASEMLFVFGYYSALYTVYALALLFAGFFFKLAPQERAVFALATCFANGAFIGVPLMEGAFGAEGVRLLLILLSFHSLTLVPVTTFLVERDRSKAAGGTRRDMLARTFASVRQNPIILALLAGLAWSSLSLPFPHVLDKVLQLPADAASPVGLFAAGLALSNVRIAGNLTHALMAVGLKLLFFPVIVFCFTDFILRLPDLWVGVATLTACLPSGMVAYSFANRYSVGARRAATTVLLSTAISAFTISVALILLKSASTT